MPWLIVVLGLGLTGAGGAAILHGFPYVQLEFGWTEVIAGATAATGGIVTLALAAVVASLDAVRRSIERNAGEQRLADQPPPLIAERPEFAPPPAAVPSDKNPPAPEPPSAAADRPAEVERVGKAARATPLRDRLAAKSAAAQQAATPLLATDVVAPSVAGRYESGGSSYVLYSDGTIEVESDTGKHRFGSMEDLKIFMASERPEALQAVPLL